MAYYARGDYGKAIDHARWNVAAFEEKLKHLPLRSAKDTLGRSFARWLSTSLAETGAFKEGILHTEEGLRIAKATNHLLAFTMPIKVWDSFFSGREISRSAVEFLEEAMAICHKADLPLMQVFSTAHLGRAYAFTGRLTEGLEMIKKAVDQSADLGMIYCHTISLYLFERRHTCWRDK